jgi:hypothetical protein
VGATPREARPPRAPPTLVTETRSRDGEKPDGQSVRTQRPMAKSSEPQALSSEPTAERQSRRGVEQRQLVGLITQRSGVRIPPPLPHDTKRPSSIARSLCVVLTETRSRYPKSPSCCTASWRRAALMSVRTEIAGKKASNSAVLSKRSRNRSATSRSRRSR